MLCPSRRDGSLGRISNNLSVQRAEQEQSDARQFACYAGVAPFGHQSGNSIHGTPHVSHLANKQIKSLL